MLKTLFLPSICFIGFKFSEKADYALQFQYSILILFVNDQKITSCNCYVEKKLNRNSPTLHKARSVLSIGLRKQCCDRNESTCLPTLILNRRCHMLVEQIGSVFCCESPPPFSFPPLSLNNNNSRFDFILLISYLPKKSINFALSCTTLKLKINAQDDDYLSRS